MDTSHSPESETGLSPEADVSDEEVEVDKEIGLNPLTTYAQGSE